MRPPQPPAGYRPASRREARLTDVVHNRRSGWLLALARHRGKIPRPGTSIAHKTSLVRQHLPELFPTPAIAREYVHDESDRPIAEHIIATMRGTTTPDQDGQDDE